MEYSPDALLALSEEVDSQGGAQLPDECRPTIITYPKKSGLGKHGTCFCGHETMYVVNYSLTASAVDKDAHQRGGGYARVCAVCDDMGTWPRYAAAVSTTESSP